jgi:hypothetical protein
MPNSNNGKLPNKAQIIAREKSCWRLRMQGWTLAKIARELGLSTSGVHKILVRIQARELKNLSRHFAAIKTEVAGQLDYIIEQCSESWHKSKEPRRRASQKTDVAGDEVTSTDVLEQCGDVSYLKTWMEAASMKMSLFGLHVQAAENQGWTLTQVVKDMQERGDLRRARLETEAAFGREDADRLEREEKNRDEATKAREAAA